MNAPAKKTAARRPSLAKKPTRAGKDKQDSVLNDGVRLVVGDVVWQVTAGDMNGLHARELRRQVGITFPGLMAVLQSEYFDVDMVAALIWLRRLIDGEDVTYTQVASETGYEVLDDFSLGGPEDDDDGADVPEG